MATFDFEGGQPATLDGLLDLAQVVRCTPAWRSNSPTGASGARVARYSSSLRWAVKRGVVDLALGMSGSWDCVSDRHPLAAHGLGICGQLSAPLRVAHKLPSPDDD